MMGLSEQLLEAELGTDGGLILA